MLTLIFQEFFSMSFVIELATALLHILHLTVADSRCPGIQLRAGMHAMVHPWHTPQLPVI